MKIAHMVSDVLIHHSVNISKNHKNKEIFMIKFPDRGGE